ncbi:hypothetical protein Godav_004486, partial [Gossypium davidsonii]|nr:hypothetical protein [Gossypium davidsonii]
GCCPVRLKKLQPWWLRGLDLSKCKLDTSLISLGEISQNSPSLAVRAYWSVLNYRWFSLVVLFRLGWWEVALVLGGFPFLVLLSVHEGFEAWVVGKIMAEEKINREAIYRALKSLWFRKEPINFVTMMDGLFLLKFRSNVDRERIFNFPSIALISQTGVAKLGYKFLAKWLGIGERQKGVDGRSASMAQEEGFMMIQKGKEKVKTRDEVSDLCSPTSKHAPQIMNLRRTMIKRKKNKVGNGAGLVESLIRMRLAPLEAIIILCWNCCGCKSRTTVCQLRQLLAITDPNIVFLSETKLWANEFEQICVRCKMDGSFVVDQNENKKGLAYYGGIGLKEVQGRCRPKVAMNNFRIIMDNLALVDVEPDKGWFTWTNNRKGNRELRDRLGRFLVFASWIGRVPFFSSSVLRQTCSDHDVVLDTMGRKLREEMRDPRLSFGIDCIRLHLGKWKFQWFKKGQDHMRHLSDRIHKHMDGPILEANVERLCASQARLGCFYEEEEEERY